MTLNNWTIIRHSGRPNHSDKWQSLRNVMDYLEDEYGHAGGNHDHAKMILHNGEVVLSSVDVGAYYMAKRKAHEIYEKSLQDHVDALLPEASKQAGRG